MSSSRRRLADIVHGWYSSAFPMTDGNEDEQTSLINTRAAFRSSCCDKIWIVVLGFVLVVGVTVSTYLLVIEGREPSPESFTMVLRSQWTSLSMCRNASRLKLPVQRILVLATNTIECWDESDCVRSLRNIEKQLETLNETGIPYNFIVAGDERIYEGRGWNCSSNYLDNGARLFTIALLGKYDDQPVPKNLRKRLEAFIAYSISQNLLSPCYHVLERDFELELTRTKNIC